MCRFPTATTVSFKENVLGLYVVAFLLVVAKAVPPMSHEVTSTAQRDLGCVRVGEPQCPPTPYGCCLGLGLLGLLRVLDLLVRESSLRCTPEKTKTIRMW